MPRKLTDKQAAFVQEYLVDLNATQAAIRAGYSAKSASKISGELLGKTVVAQAISEAKAARAEVVTRTAADVLRDIIAVTEEARQHGEHKTALKCRCTRSGSSPGRCRTPG